MSTATERYTEAQQDLADAEEDARLVRVALILGIILAVLAPISIAGCAVLASIGQSELAGGAGGLIGFTVVGTALCIAYVTWDVGSHSETISRWDFHKRQVRKAQRACNEAAARLVSE